MQNGGNFGRSTSRITLFHHCNKKYFFQYYTNYLKTISTDIRLDALLLKNLTSFKMWLGEKTHHIIADYLRLLNSSSNSNITPTNQSVIARKEQSDGRGNPGDNSMDPSLPDTIGTGRSEGQIEQQIMALKNSMRSTMQQEFSLAQSRQYKRYDKDQKFGFKEFCYDDDIDDQLEEGIEIVLSNLDAFIDSPLHTTVQGYFTKGYKSYIESNESDFEQMKLVLDHHPILQDVTIWAGPDFGIAGPDNTYYIYDRKSGREKDILSDSITDQLKIYAYKLLCNTKKTVDDLTIYAYEVYVPSMNMIGGKVTQTDIDSIKDKVIDDVHELQELVQDQDIKKNIPVHVDRFQRTIDPNKCANCSFRRACAALKKIDGDATPNPVLDALASQIDGGRLF